MKGTHILLGCLVVILTVPPLHMPVVVGQETQSQILIPPLRGTTRYSFRPIRMRRATCDMPVGTVEAKTSYHFNSGNESFDFHYLGSVSESGASESILQEIRDLYRGEEFQVISHHSVRGKTTYVVEGILKRRPRRFRAVVVAIDNQIYGFSYTAGVRDWDAFASERERFLGSATVQ